MSLLAELGPVRWFEAEPERLLAELTAMTAVAPELTWKEDDQGGGWEGLAPVWPFDRIRPFGLDGFLDGRRFRLRVACSPAHPMVAPRVQPLDPEPSLAYRTAHVWHVTGDGSLCLLQSAAAWTGSELAAELVVKAAGWFLEYLLMDRGVVTTMSLGGIATTSQFDYLLAPVSAQDERPVGAEGG
jgi:hypothetical protein